MNYSDAGNYQFYNQDEKDNSIVYVAYYPINHTIITNI